MSIAPRWLEPCVALAATLLVAQSANAGPPLICHPFSTDNAPSLPWTAERTWRAVEASYDVSRLTADTLALLVPDAPVIARMETLRRATIYAVTSRQAAADLLQSLLARAKAAGRQDAHAAALALFDAGYLIESYRQLSEIDTSDMLGAFARSNGVPLGALNGYALVEDAIAMQPPDVAAMELGASLMTKDKAAARQHRLNAAAGAAPGSALAANIEELWGNT
jgi:hypothetical protein